MTYHLLSDITPASKQWNICARVTRMWEYRGGVDHGTIQHLDLVLIDAQGNAIYGEVPGQHVEAKKQQLQEGHVYAFSRFLVCANKAKYRAVDTKYMIELTFYTQIQKIDDVPPDFPAYAYKLVPFADLPAYVGETRTFVDVIGAVVGVSNTTSIQGANQIVPTIRRIVILQDASNHEVKLTIWGKRASEFDADQIYETGQSQHVIVLFVGLLMKRYGHKFLILDRSFYYLYITHCYSNYVYSYRLLLTYYYIFSQKKKSFIAVELILVLLTSYTIFSTCYLNTCLYYSLLPSNLYFTSHLSFVLRFIQLSYTCYKQFHTPCLHYVAQPRHIEEEGLTGNAACRWHISPHIPESSHIKSSLQSQFQSVYRIVLQDQVPPSAAISTTADEKTLQEIVDINPFDFPPSGLVCTVTIARLSAGQTWFFFSCNKCSKKSIPDGDSYRCSFCLCRAAKPRYKLCVVATNGTAEAEFILFGDVGQHIVGKQVGAILRSNKASDKIPPDIAQVVCKKFAWLCSITERSFQGPTKTYQVNRVIAALGRQLSIPSLSSSIYIASGSTQSATSSTSTTIVPLPLQLTTHTPPSPQHLAITDKTEHTVSKDDHTPLVSTQKRLFQQTDTSQQSTHQTASLQYSDEQDSPKHSGKKQLVSGVAPLEDITVLSSRGKEHATTKKN